MKDSQMLTQDMHHANHRRVQLHAWFVFLHLSWTVLSESKEAHQPVDLFIQIAPPLEGAFEFHVDVSNFAFSVKSI